MNESMFRPRISAESTMLVLMVPQVKNPLLQTLAEENPVIAVGRDIQRNVITHPPVTINR